ncbi:AAA domain-containing protein [Niabella aurantiaca]|uniref:AAA domain-containing protein n=1 Tax=Niabella aurantiaca TaxID=379900 RepID=UPI000376521F|nr:AAA domain-containing protein [Niabella aurantiaca]
MNYKRWLTYWKKSLADSLRADIEPDKLPHFEIEDFEILTNRLSELGPVNELIDIEEARINYKNGITDNTSEKWEFIREIQVIIAPFKLRSVAEHLMSPNGKKTIFPFWYYAIVNRNGELKVPEEHFPAFQRKYLDPLADEKTDFIFSSVEAVDKAAALGKEEYKSYKEYIIYVKEVFRSAVDQDVEQYSTGVYETLNHAVVLLPEEEINAAVGIIQLYEKILNEKKIPALLQRFITLKNDKSTTPKNVSELIALNILHLGQMGFDFPISISQRKSLYTFLNANDQVFAVNGPPGTGKTTLLQSIIANKMVESAIAGENAPVILACSTNNQAVTNIIDSFSRSNTKEGTLQGRWLPAIEGYATYLPANGKTEAELKGIHYKKLSGEGIFSKIENREYLVEAKDYYMQKSGAYFGEELISVDEAVIKLQKEIRAIKAVLENSTEIWMNYLEAEQLFTRSYLFADRAGTHYFKETILHEDQFRADITDLEKLEQRIIVYFRTEPFFRKLGCFLGIKSAERNRISEVKIILRGSLIELTEDFRFTKADILGYIDTKILLAKTIIKTVEEWKSWKSKNTIKGNPPRSEEEYWEFELAKPKNRQSANCFYDELDISLRHKAFQLALHYWEGAYLIQLDSDLSDPNFDKKGMNAVMNRWRRQAKLTPCFVSTFYMAPKFFSYFKFLQKGDGGKNIYDNPPLLNFIDLLIVDEAGQVSPEVGVATFSIAKQAVVVGDIKQIEPVWNIPNKVDIGNLRKVGLIKNYDDLIYEEEFDPKGFLASTGSIMKMAQNACNFKEEHLDEKGVILTEHRRCFDEIITYCNVLAYNGLLVPLKGKAPKDLLFPPMYCIHVEGSSIVTGTSRQNENEVKRIIEWLVTYKKQIQNKYGKLEDAVGIITPFVGQKRLLKNALKQAGFDTNVLKVGTVHALQGAERSIILFSMVYGKGDSGSMFFDRDNKPNMLNVAVSRAKDNFIVFANTAIFNKNAKTPSGILAKHLTYEKQVQGK